MSTTTLCPKTATLYRITPVQGGYGGEQTTFLPDPAAVNVPCDLQPARGAVQLLYAQRRRVVSHQMYFDQDWKVNVGDRWYLDNDWQLANNLPQSNNRQFTVEGWVDSLEQHDCWVYDVQEIDTVGRPAQLGTL